MMSQMAQTAQNSQVPRGGSNGVVNGAMSMPLQPRPHDAGLGGASGVPAPAGAMSSQNLNQIVGVSYVVS